VEQRKEKLLTAEFAKKIRRERRLNLSKLPFSALSAAFLRGLGDSKLSHPALKSRSEEIYANEKKLLIAEVAKKTRRDRRENL